MATVVYRVTDSPVNLLAANDIHGTALGLTNGKTDSCRYVGNGSDLLKVLESATAPEAGADALPIKSLEDVTIVPRAGEGVYAWSRNGVGKLVINEVTA